MPYYVYILSNPRHTVLYTGVTNDLTRRLHEHRTHAAPGFTATYHATQLMYYAETSDVHSAIAEEKRIKGLSRAKKEQIIFAFNPRWEDLSAGWFEG